MILDLLRKIYYKLPEKYIIIFRNIYVSIKLKQHFESPDHFPANYFGKTQHPILSKSRNEGYFYRLYQEKDTAFALNPEDLFKFKYEIVKGEYIKSNQYSLNSKENSVYPVSLDKSKSSLTINKGSESEVILNNIGANRFHYFKVNKGSNLNLESKSNFVVGNALPLNQKIQHKKKLVLCIFIDGLVDLNLIESEGYKKFMPNTYEYFKKGIIFKNHYSNAEWTLPSVPTFFTGNRQQGHGFFAPKGHHNIGETEPILSEIFKINDYLTFQANGNWRMSPSYGYTKGFDRTIYKKEMDAFEIISTFLEHMRTFNKRDNFVWLTFMEAHHLLKYIPDISNQVENSVAAHKITPWYDPDNTKKSVFTSNNSELIEIYKNEIMRLDYYLKIIYDYISSNYTDNEVVINLMSDHGQAYVSDDQHPLSVARTKVPWMIRGGEISESESHEMTENIDIFKSLLKSSDLNFKDYNNESQIPIALGGTCEREYVLSQSIYPGQTYKAVIRNKNIELKYESTLEVQKNGMIRGELYLKDSKVLHEGSPLESEIETYNLLVKTKIDEWNKAI